MAKNKKTLTLTEIINAPKKVLDASEKVVAIAKKVEQARKVYGNTDAEITAPEVNTCEGAVDLAFLDAADKVAVAGSEIRKIRVQAIETTKQTEGSVLDAEVVRLIAVNPVLCNITAATESAYI